MSNVLFLGKIKNSNDRDCVKYMEFIGFQCGHYFGGLQISGSCFSGFEDDIKNNVDNFETVLTKEELLKLFELNDKLKELGCGIKKNSEKYKQGMEILEEYENTIGKKLLSEENKKLFKKIIEEEKEIIKEEWDLSDNDIKQIFDKYSLSYNDRSIVAYVYSDFYELGKQFADDCYNIDEHLEKYFDYKKLGKDISNNQDYVILNDGKIVYLAY